MFDHRIFTFLTLYREMNYRKTAEILNMTQPGVTQHIHFLEKFYNVKLFHYDGRTLSRTKNADILKKYMDRLLMEERELRLAFLGKEEFFLKIGATKTIGEFVLLPMAERFLRLPKNRLELVIDNTEILLTMLDDGDLDFALIEGTFDKNKYEYQLFQKERFLGICAQNHRFAGKKVGFTDIFSQTLFVREKGSGTRGILEQVLQDYSFSLQNFNRVMSISNFAAIQRFVADGLGISFAYQSVADADPRLATFEMEDMSIIREFNYVYLNEAIALEKIARFSLSEGE